MGMQGGGARALMVIEGQRQGTLMLHGDEVVVKHTEDGR
jgi:hypothetical protein